MNVTYAGTCIRCDRPMVVKRTRAEHMPAGHVRRGDKAGRCVNCHNTVRRGERAAERPKLPKPPKPPWLRYPAEPLLDAIRRAGVSADGPDVPRPGRSAVQCARTRGYLTARAADIAAVQILGAHPCEVWGESWWLPESECVA